MGFYSNTQIKGSSRMGRTDGIKMGLQRSELRWFLRSDGKRDGIWGRGLHGVFFFSSLFWWGNDGLLFAVLCSAEFSFSSLIWWVNIIVTDGWMLASKQMLLPCRCCCCCYSRWWLDDWNDDYWLRWMDWWMDGYNVSGCILVRLFCCLFIPLIVRWELRLAWLLELWLGLAGLVGRCGLGQIILG